MATFENACLVIGLGAARTGTKWMSGYFAAHPDVLMPERLMHFFDTDQQFNELYRSRLARATAKMGGEKPGRDGKTSEKLKNLQDRVGMIGDPAKYIEFYRTRWSCERAFADITPSYCQLASEAYERMICIHSNVRFLFVMRNPIDRIWSDLRVRAQRDNTLSPYAALDERLSSSKSTWPNPYRRALDNLEAVIPAHAARVFFFEELFKQESISSLCDFIGVRRYPAEIDVPQNQADPYPLDRERRHLMYRKFAGVFEYVGQRYGDRLPECWRQDMKEFDHE